MISPSKFSGYTSFGLPIINLGPEGTNADIVCKKFGAGISIQNKSQIDDALVKLLNPNTQASTANNTRTTIEYFSENAGFRLADFLCQKYFNIAKY